MQKQDNKIGAFIIIHLLWLSLFLNLNLFFVLFLVQIIRTSAKSLAERAGAAQYAVHIEEELSPEEIGNKHDLRKRLSDENAFDDSDYEIYQGVVGRPGVDFPVMTGIPQTTFNCRKFGNGYFADLETECQVNDNNLRIIIFLLHKTHLNLEYLLQVFHICEGGKKISFLCPNGTIFQQTDLICDWWFKVNCAASPGHYAESSEILSRAQHRYKPNSHKVTVGDGLTATVNPFIIRPAESSRQRSIDPFDFQSDTSNESYEENISAPIRQSSRGSSSRRSKAHSRDTSKFSSSKETQEVAASSSFVGSGNNNNNNFNGYHYREPSDNQFTFASEKKTTSSNENQSTVTTTAASTVSTVTTTTTAAPRTTTTVRITTTTSAPTTKTPSSAESSEKDEVFNGYHYLPPERTSRRLESTRAPAPTRIPSTNEANRLTTEQPSSFVPRETTTQRNSNRQTESTIIESIDTTTQTRPTTTAPPLIRNSTPQSLRRNSSALIDRIRPNTSRTTPFYTPTVPTILSNRISATERTTFGTTENLPTASPLAVSEHAMEMMKTLQELKLDTTVQPTASSDNDYDRLRPGLVIPPSSGPDALNALAIFYATANDNLASNRTENLRLPGLEDLDVQIGNISRLSSALVSNSTAQKYENLFGIDSSKEHSKENFPEITSNSHTGPSSTAGDNDLETEFSSNPLLAAAGTPQIRELAQVFTHALSAYLHDPQTFRRVLSEIRPTEPNVPRSTEFLTNRIGRTDEFNKGTGPTYLPTASTLSATATTPPIPTTEDHEILEFSDVTASTINKETTPTTTDSTPATTQSSTDPTTNLPQSTKSSLSTTHTQILKKSLNHIDHVPASRILTEALENTANNRYTNSLLEATTESSNPLAMEINGGLIITTNYPYLQEDENVNSTGYFPVRNRLGDDDSRRSSYQPYGQGVQPSNSTPIFDRSPKESSTPSLDVTTGTTEPPASLSFDLLPPAAINKGFTLPINDILPPVDDNDLQRAQSQSIYGNGNDISIRGGKTAKLIDATAQRKESTIATETTTNGPINGHYITQTISPSTPAPEKLTRTTIPDSGKITSPWSTLAYTVFLDPLTINDGLMEANDGTITPSPNTYLPRSTQTPTYAEVSQTATESLRALADADRRGKAVPSSTARPSDYMEVMQQKANEMFGGLNDTSVDHLMNVMKKADKSKTVRRLILLLIQTCDDDYNTTVEESRTALLNALIGMDGKIDEENELQIIKTHRNPNRSAKNIAAPGLQNRFGDVAPAISSTSIPITTYHRPIIDVFNRNGFTASSSAASSTPQYVPSTVATTTPATFFTTTSDFDDIAYKSTISDTTEFETTTNYYPTVTEYPTTYRTTVRSTQRPATTVANKNNSRRNSSPSNGDSKRVSKDLDRYLGTGSSLQVDASHKHSDTRALELLRSLYSLAGRFGK